MWASAYPQSDCVWPESHATVDRISHDVGPQRARKILRENARALYAEHGLRS
jgi:hypothetical protein